MLLKRKVNVVVNLDFNPAKKVNKLAQVKILLKRGVNKTCGPFSASMRVLKPQILN